MIDLQTLGRFLLVAATALAIVGVLLLVGGRLGLGSLPGDFAWSNEKWTVSGQYGRQGWSVFEELALVFPENPDFNESVEQNYEDSDRYGLGLEYRANPRWAFQLGLEHDNTPQPTEAMSPLLGDGDRDVYSFGVSWKAKKFWLDVAYQYIEINGRSTNGEAIVGFDGLYESSANLFAASLGWMF